MKRPHGDISRRLAATRLVACDVDGTLTDGSMWYGSGGEELKRFSTRDGHGIGRLMAGGIEVAFITAEDSPIVTARASKLGVRHVVLGCRDKFVALETLCDRLGIDTAATVAVGDDLGDLPMFDAAGVSIAVADAEPEVLNRADLVTDRPGGFGAVREVADLILGLTFAAAHS